MKREINNMKREFDKTKREADIMKSSKNRHRQKTDEIHEDFQNRHALLKQKQNRLAKEGNAVVTVADYGKDNPVGSNHTCFNHVGLNHTVPLNNSKQILKGFNQECNRLIRNVSSKNSDSSRVKILERFEYLNHVFAAGGISITEDFLKIKLEELNLVHAYHIRLENEKAERILRDQSEENK